MAALGEILRRFRFHGVPGAPSVVGVPADRTAGLRAELTPVFGALGEVQRRADELVTAAERDAARVRAEATGEARRILAAATDGRAAVRAEATAAGRARAEATRAGVLAAGRAEAQRVAAQASARTDALVERVVAHVLALADTAGEPWT